MRIELLTSKYFEIYEAFLEQHECAMLYYSIKFKLFLEKLTASEALYYIAIENDKIVGALPLMCKSGKFGKVINSLPYYGSNGGVLAKNDIVKNALIKKYLEIINSGEFLASTLIENPLDTNKSYLQLENTENDYRIGQFTKIQGAYSDIEDLMIKFHYKTRNTIRKAVKSEVTVAVENNMFQFLEETHIENMQSIGGLAKTKQFFALISEIFEPEKDFNIYVARKDGIPIAALLVFYSNRVVEYYTPVIVKEFRHVQALSLLITQAMFDAAKDGFVWWNWGGTWATQGGVYDFKSRWGTIDLNYNYHIKINNPQVYNLTKEELLSEYPSFFVLPFSKLKTL